MRLIVAIALAALAGTLPTVARAETKCRDEVKAAFAKQREAIGYRIDLKAAQGPDTIDVMTEYIRPDRMREAVSAKDGQISRETIVIGSRVWTKSGTAWQELAPEKALPVIGQMAQTVADRSDSLPDYSCLGKVSLEAKEYLAYRATQRSADSKPEVTPDGVIAQTLYVDPATGLPAHNIVGPSNEGASPMFKASYSYPGDIKIEIPQGSAAAPAPTPPPAAAP